MQLKEKTDLTPLEIADCKTGRMLGPLRRQKGIGSRKRIKLTEVDACYHVMSRTAGGEFLFDDQAKEAFRKMMWKMATFAGVEVLTYCVMDNHFHILVRVPERTKWLRRFEGVDGEEKLLKHLAIVYSRAFMAQLKDEVSELREKGYEAEIQKLLQGFKDRLCDVSKFVKELKERFSRWYNKIYGRRGTLWMDRFKSVLVQGPGKVSDPLDVENATLMMANYIDLNPVRAGICKDPKGYRFCGYAEAVAGSKRARRGLNKVMSLPMDDWESSTRNRTPGSEQYRILLFGKAVKTEKRKGISREESVKVAEKGGKLSRTALLRCKVRYFTDGMMLGDQAFLKKLLSSGEKDIRKLLESKKHKPKSRAVQKGFEALQSFRTLKAKALE